MSGTRRALAALALPLLLGSACGARPIDQKTAAAARGAEPAPAAAPLSGAAAEGIGVAAGNVTVADTTAAPVSGTAGASSPAPAAPGGPAAKPATGSGGSPAMNANGAGQPVPAASAAKSPTSAGTSGSAAVSTPAPGGGSAPAPGGAPAPAKASPITIGSVGTQSGIVGNVFASVAKGVQVWVDDVNRRGGVNGHAVRHIIADDGGDPSRHQALVKQLVEEKGVIAFVGQNAALTGGASVAYLNQKRVPVLGSEGGSSWFYGNPMFFPQFTHTPTLVTSTIGAGAQVFTGKKKLGVISCVEVQGCRDYNDLTPEAAKPFGIEVVYRGQVSLGQPDFTAECLAARNAGAEMMILAADANTMTRVARSCAAAGYKPGYMSPHSVTDDVRKDPALDGLVVESPMRPWFGSDSPALAELHNAMAKGAPGEDVTIGYGAGWVSAKLFERAARNLGEPATAEGVLAGLWSIQNDDLAGLTYPLSFAKDAPVAKKACWWPVQVANGKWADRSGGQVTCRG
jgi:ABC-type branched-subunit amino acid transport system substrate-binding protein